MSITLRSVPHSLPDELSSDGRNLVVALDSLNAVLATRPRGQGAGGAGHCGAGNGCRPDIVRQGAVLCGAYDLPAVRGL